MRHTHRDIAFGRQLVQIDGGGSGLPIKNHATIGGWRVHTSGEHIQP